MKNRLPAVAAHALLFLLIAFAANAQKLLTVKGVVMDSTRLPLPSCTVKLYITQKDSLAAITGAGGTFEFRSVKGSHAVVSVTSEGYGGFAKLYDLSTSDTVITLDTIFLQPLYHNLNPVSVTSVNPVTVMEDTVQYKADAYKVRPNAPLEDMLRKLPGVDVDANGNVTAQGKQVTKVRVNGKDFFGGDVKTATQNLPADIVDNVQMIDDYGDQANLTGVKTGEPNKIMNVTLKPDKNHGFTGQATVGAGSDALPQNPGVTNSGRYAGLVNILSFNGEQQIALLGNVNNTNLNTFSFGNAGQTNAVINGKIAMDNISIGKISIGGGGGFASQAAQQNGITTTHSTGVNFRDQWGKSLSVYGSYSFANNTVATTGGTLQQNTSLANPSTSLSQNNEADQNINHRFNWNMEYRPDTTNYLKVTPSFSWAGSTTNAFQNTVAKQNGAMTEAYSSTQYGTSVSPAYGLNTLYNHRFKRRGRNLSADITLNASPANQYQNPVYLYTAGTAQAPANQHIQTGGQNQNYGVNLSYLEPLGKLSFLELDYAFNHSYTATTKQTTVLDSTSHFFVPDSSLSNLYNYRFTTNRVGLNYRFAQKVFNYTLGVAVEPSSLNGNSPAIGLQTRRTAVNIVPAAHLNYQFKHSRSLGFNYSGNASQPSFAQLQPVTNFSNALYPVQGNPSLKQQFTNNFSAHYNQFDFSSGNTFFSNISYSQTQNQVVTNTTAFPAKYAPNPALQNTYLTQYANANGYYNANAYISYAKPWAKRKYTLMFNGSANYTNNIGFITNVDSVTYAQTTLKNTARNIVFTPGMRFRVDLPDITDAQVSVNYSVSKTFNSIVNTVTSTNANIRTLGFGLRGKQYWHDWTLSYEYSKLVNYGYTVATTNPNILNMYVERMFFKNKATLRFAVYDLFNQNTDYSSSVTASAITQTTTNRLGRYYLLTFTLRLQKFAPLKEGDKKEP